MLLCILVLPIFYVNLLSMVYKVAQLLSGASLSWQVLGSSQHDRVQDLMLMSNTAVAHGS